MDEREVTGKDDIPVEQAPVMEWTADVVIPLVPVCIKLGSQEMARSKAKFQPKYQYRQTNKPKALQAARPDGRS